MSAATTIDMALVSRPVQSDPDFRAYLENSLRDPFTINLRGLTLMETIGACIRAKSRLMPGYGRSLGGLIHNLGELERQYRVTLQTVQVTDVFWSHFVAFCMGRGLKASSTQTMCTRLRSVLGWAGRYNAILSPTYRDFRVPRTADNQIALTADEVSRVAYFDVQRFYRDRRKDYRDTMERVRDMFVLSCNLYQRHSDMVRIEPSCFDRNVFTITQQKTGNRAVVNIDQYAIDAKTTYRILERYGYRAPYTATIGNYNHHLHRLMKDIGFTDAVRVEERRGGRIETADVPKWRLICSHTARRTAITVNVLRGHNVHALKRCSGHSDLRTFDSYVRDE